MAATNKCLAQSNKSCAEGLLRQHVAFEFCALCRLIEKAMTKRLKNKRRSELLSTTAWIAIATVRFTPGSAITSFVNPCDKHWERVSCGRFES